MPRVSKPPVARPVGAKTVDDYLAKTDPAARRVLASMRAAIKQAVPEAREVISYQIPTYLHHGPLVHMAVQPRHLAFYVISLDVLHAFKAELEPFDVAGRTVRFAASKPLPTTLVRKIVKMRVKENESRAKS